jgi:Zn-dependent protease
MGLINLLLENPLAFALLAFPLLYSVIIHEIAHGWVAFMMGDPTAKHLGRLSLNPLRHLDPIGTAMLFFVGFGWAKPVPVNFANVRPGRKGLILVSAAGITANLLLAFLAYLLLRVVAPAPQGAVSLILLSFAQINIILASFNLIPIPPLDGSKILQAFLPPHAQAFMMRLEPYGFFILIGLLLTGVLTPLIEVFRWVMMTLIALLLH